MLLTFLSRKEPPLVSLLAPHILPPTYEIVISAVSSTKHTVGCSHQTNVERCDASSSCAFPNSQLNQGGMRIITSTWSFWTSCRNNNLSLLGRVDDSATRDLIQLKWRL
ncbi:hypothetical protein H0G86_006134 [Trichoderma simmonsii]|uniref:Uncharacterized protein n=1 Tax=Trichoderma simmonsii TaxID=1491479 RepID=A0A8G0LCY1_9HYPO|nr:hypothetical protein H0G86_006134 [Trichoderma simmonsii]